jgi:DNA-binding ferritin-like protein
MSASNTLAKNGPDLIKVLMQVQIATKMFHWQTRSYSAHAATGELYDDVVKYTDELIEQLMGVYGRPRMAPNTVVTIPNMSKSDMNSLLTQTIDYLSGPAVPPDTHLQNVRDELTSAMARTMYVLTHK